MKKGLLAVLVCLIIIPAGYGQEQNPSSIKWKSIQTEHFQVVFPENCLLQGQKTAGLLEQAYEPVGKSMGQKPKKIPVFLYNQSVISNGFTALAPRQIVYYTTPPQAAGLVGGADWLQTLTIHEYRHAVQYAKLDNDFLSFIGGLFGDYGKLVAMNFTVPVWAFEGDAVCVETALTNDGRGRLPSFLRDYRAMTNEWMPFTYHQTLFGSYKLHFPDYYKLGYIMSSYVRKQYGDETWDSIWSYVPKVPLYPWRFSDGLKRYTKYNMNRTFKHSMTDLQHSSQRMQKQLVQSPSDTVFYNPSQFWTSYQYPYWLNDSSIIALKYGLDDSPKLVKIKNGVEEKLRDINPSDRIHSNGNFVVWCEEAADLRWGQKSFSNLVIYSATSKNLIKLTRHQKLFAPAISPSGKLIAALEYGENMEYSLVILSSLYGKEIERFTFPDDQIIRMPAWSPSEDIIVFTKSIGQKKYLTIINLKTGEISDLHYFGYENISNPVWIDHYIYYNSPAAGVDAIHAFDFDTKAIFVVCQGKYGVYNPSLTANNKLLLHQSYSTDGFFISSSANDAEQWQLLSEVKTFTDSTWVKLVAQEQSGSIFEKSGIDQTDTLTMKTYRPLLHAFSIHSWAPYPVNNGLGFSIYSNDRLNTTSIVAGLNYFPNDQALREFAAISYAQYYPVFGAEFSNGQKYTFIETDSSSKRVPINEKIYRLSIGLPLNFSKGIYTSSLLLTSGYNFLDYRYTTPDSLKEQIHKMTQAIDFDTKFSILKQKSIRAVDYQSGFETTLNYWQSVNDQYTPGYRVNLFAKAYFPGFFKSHSISIGGGYENSTEAFRYGVYQLTSDIEFVHGYSRPDYNKLKRGILEYKMPLLDSDFSISRVMYFKRFSTNLFFDTGETEKLLYSNSSEIQKERYTSIGFDLNTEFYLFSWPIPFSMGFRFSYLSKYQKPGIEFLLLGQPF